MAHLKTPLLAALLLLVLASATAVRADSDFDDIGDDDYPSGMIPGRISALPSCSLATLARDYDADVRQCALALTATGCPAACKKIVDTVGKPCLDQLIWVASTDATDAGDRAELAIVQNIAKNCASA